MQIKTAPSDRLLNVSEAAGLLAVKVSTLYGWAYLRKIPVVKLGRSLRFRLSVITKLIADSERPAMDNRRDNLNDQNGDGPSE
jgi:excisionase family DNA binding protein